MRIIAVIPARGGSKGVPGKNIRSLGSMPLIVWTILAAKKVESISEIIVNTDDDHIAQVAKSFGAQIYRRPDYLGGDLSTDLEVYQDFLQSRKDMLPDMVVDLRATAPFRGARRIAQGIQMLISTGIHAADSVRAVTLVEKHPYKMWRLEGDHLHPLFPASPEGTQEPFNMPRQALPPIFQNNGSMNAFWPATVLEQHSMTGKNILGYVMTEIESINIDTEEDFQFAMRVVAEKGVTPDNIDTKFNVV